LLLEKGDLGEKGGKQKRGSITYWGLMGTTQPYQRKKRTGGKLSANGKLKVETRKGHKKVSKEGGRRPKAKTEDCVKMEKRANF